MQLGVTLTSLAIGAVGEPVFAEVFDPIPAAIISFGLAFLLISYLHVVIGELVPKGLALGHSESVALAVSTPVSWFFVVFKPLIWLLEKSSDGLCAPSGSSRRVLSAACLLGGRAEDAPFAARRSQESSRRRSRRCSTRFSTSPTRRSPT